MNVFCQNGKYLLRIHTNLKDFLRRFNLLECLLRNELKFFFPAPFLEQSQVKKIIVEQSRVKKSL